MEFSLNAAMNASEEIADSIHYPNLRLSTVATLPGAKQPVHDVPSIANYTDASGKVVAWRRSEPDAFAPATSTTFSYFSAVCYLFGRDLYRMKGGAVPIGLVASDVGGVKIETLMSPDALEDDTCGGTAYARADTVADNSSLVPGLDGSVWNGMIYPLLPMRFHGVVFYQGESNSLSGCPSAYACMFPALVADWRSKFGLPDLFFDFVQLAAYGWHDYTHLRQAQLAALQLPNVGMATAVDLGDMKSPNGGIHPRCANRAALAWPNVDPIVRWNGCVIFWQVEAGGWTPSRAHCQSASLPGASCA
jgi:sialate O-acetylesterase